VSTYTIDGAGSGQSGEHLWRVLYRLDGSSKTGGNLQILKKATICKNRGVINRGMQVECDWPVGRRQTAVGAAEHRLARSRRADPLVIVTAK